MEMTGVSEKCEGRDAGTDVTTTVQDDAHDLALLYFGELEL